MHTEEAARQEYGAWKQQTAMRTRSRTEGYGERTQRLGTLAYRSYVRSLGPLFRPLHHSHLEVRQK